MDASSFADHWQQMSDEVLRQMLEWRQAHPQATFLDIERETDRRLGALRAQLLQEVAQASELTDGGPPAERGPCPQCGGATDRNGRRRRRLLSQQQQAVQLERQQLRCRQCGHTFFPPG